MDTPNPLLPTARGTRGPARSSTWGPLRHSLFRAIWIASIASNIGTWMQNIGATWLMTSLCPSPLMVSLVQVANYLPTFFLSLPAGALADLMDRRKVLLFTQTWMLIAAALLGYLTWMHAVSPASLLLLTFLLAIGNALNSPAWQAIVPELVPREELGPAVALGSTSFNLARALGPALGGLVVAIWSPAANFYLNAASFLAVIVVLYQWKREPLPVSGPPEHMIGAMITGLRYARHSQDLGPITLRAIAFVIPGSAIWALLPILTRDSLGGSAGVYGLLLGCLGAGAVIGTLILSTLRARRSIDDIVTAATVTFGGVSLACGLLHNAIAAGACLVLGGMAWLCCLNTLNVLVQYSVPEWVRARALSIYLLLFFAAMTLGSAFFGALGEATGTPLSVVIAGGTMFLTIPLRRWFPLRIPFNSPHLQPAAHWPELEATAGDIDPERGPVLVIVEYEVDPREVACFRETMAQVRLSRRRDGASLWRLYQNTANPNLFHEIFRLSSWGEHLRLHKRGTVGDRDLEQKARGFHLGPGSPRVTHLVSASRLRP